MFLQHALKCAHVCLTRAHPQVHVGVACRLHKRCVGGVLRQHSTAQHVLCQCPSETVFMAGCGGARWSAEQWLFVCCPFLLAVIIAPPPLKMASRFSIMQVGAHVHVFMLPQECLHTPATCLWREDVRFLSSKYGNECLCYLLIFAIYKRLREMFVTVTSFVFQTLVIIQLADAQLFW